jgi:SH3 domain protein
MRKIGIFLALLVWFVDAGAQSTRYVTDSLRLEVRTGPSTGYRITRMLESGTAVTVLEESEGYSRVRAPGGSQGWILTRYLMDQPSARNQVASAKAELEKVSTENAELRAALETALSTGDETENARNKLEQDFARVSKELDEIRRTAAATLTIEQQNRELQANVINLERELQLAQQENMSLSDRSDRDWFVTGAGVLLGGMILGLILPRMRWKRRRGWGEI